MAATKISVCLVHWIHSHGELKGQEVLDYYFPVACGSVFFFCCLPVFWVISPDTKLLVSFSQWSSVILLSVLYLPGCIIVVSSPPGIKKMGHSWLSGECCSPFLLNVLCYFFVFNLVIFKGVILSFYINVTGDSLSFLTVSSIGFAIALHIPFIGFLKFLLWVVFVDCIGVGLVIASLLW